MTSAAALASYPNSTPPLMAPRYVASAATGLLMGQDFVVIVDQRPRTANKLGRPPRGELR